MSDFYALESGITNAILLEDGTWLVPESTPILFLGSVGTEAATGLTTNVMDVIMDVPAGSLICVGFVINANPTISSVFDSQGNTYIQDNDTGTTGAPVSHAWTYHSITTADLFIGDTISVTSSAGTSRFAMVADAFAPVSSAPDGVSNTVANNTSPTTSTTGTLTATGDSAVWGIFANSDTQVATITSGHTISSDAVTTVGSNERHIQSMYGFTTGTGSVAITGTFGSPQAWGGAIITAPFV